MSRDMKLMTGKCACCGKQQTINMAFYSKSDRQDLNLTEYYDFKFVNVNFCENCGYVNNDLTKLIGEHTKSVVASERYQIAVDDGYMDGYEDLPYQEYEDMAIGEFDGLAMLYKAEKSTGLEYALIQHRIAELKSVLRGEYYETYCDKYDDEEREDYEALIDELSRQISEADNECMKALKNVKLKYPYEVIFVAECLTRVEKYDKARELIAGVEANFTFDEELKDYIEEFLTEVEKI